LCGLKRYKELRRRARMLCTNNTQNRKSQEGWMLEQVTGREIISEASKN